MKKIIFYTSFLMLQYAACAQEAVKFNVTYEFVYVRDLSNVKNPYKINMVLSLGANTSRYCTEKLFLENDKKSIAARKRAIQQMEQTPASGAMPTAIGGPMLTFTKGGTLINEEVTMNFVEKKQLIVAKVATRLYSVPTDLSEMKWVVTTESKKIGAYTCQKATTRFGGRSYEGWFTSEIPYQAGPWKLQGLPGLILEAKDSTNEVVFTFKSITKNEDNEETTSSFLNSPYAIKTKIADLQKANAAFESDPEGVMSAQVPNARVYIRNLDEPNNKNVQKIKKYNPMELL